MSATIGETKNKEERTVPISTTLRTALKQRKAKRAELYGVPLPEAFIFNRTESLYKPIYPTDPTKWQRKFTQRHGLRNVSA